MTRALAVLVGFVTFFSGAAYGQLAWDQTTVVVKTAAQDSEARAEFAFVNKADHVVHITDIKTSCGCTSALPSKKELAPGEKATLKAAVQIGEHQGRVSKTVTVMTDDGQKPQTLTVTLDIPQLLEMTPAQLEWSRGKEVKPATIAVKVVSPVPLHVTKVSDAHPFVGAQLKMIKDGEQYELTVTPDAIGFPDDYKILLQTDLKTSNGSAKQVLFTVTVK